MSISQMHEARGKDMVECVCVVRVYSQWVRHVRALLTRGNVEKGGKSTHTVKWIWFTSNTPTSSTCCAGPRVGWLGSRIWLAGWACVNRPSLRFPRDKKFSFPPGPNHTPSLHLGENMWAAPTFCHQSNLARRVQCIHVHINTVHVAASLIYGSHLGLGSSRNEEQDQEVARNIIWWKLLHALFSVIWVSNIIVIFSVFFLVQKQLKISSQCFCSDLSYSFSK